MEYRPGKRNWATDALSRRDEDAGGVHALAITRPEFQLFEDFKQEAVSLPEIVAKRREIEAGTAGASWTIMDEFLMHRGRVFVPRLPVSGHSYWKQLMVPAMKVFRRPCIVFVPPSIIQERLSSSVSSSRVARSVKGARRNTSILPVSFNPLMFHRRFGVTLPWIL